MTIKERFFQQRIGYAPFSFGPPSILHPVENGFARKTMEEKWKLYNFKKQHPKTRNHKFSLYAKMAF